MRLQWFFESLKGVAMVRHCSNVEDAFPILAVLEPEVVVFLDHDLCLADAAFPDVRPGSGQRVARFLSERGSIFTR